MPLKASQLPADFRTLWDAVKQLQRDVRELRAARTAEKTAIGAGGLTIQDPTSAQKMIHTPRSSRTFAVGAGLVNPPAVEFWSGLAAETKPGAISAFEGTGVAGPLPSLIAITGDVGNGDAYVLLQAGDPAGNGALLAASADGAQLTMTGQTFVVSFNGGGGLAFDTLGGFIPGASWTALPMNNGWSSASTPWQAPQYNRMLDSSVQLIGSMVPGTLTSGTVIATLPTAFAPVYDMEFRVPGGSATAAADLVVHGTSGASGGQITITNITGTITRIGLNDVRISF